MKSEKPNNKGNAQAPYASPSVKVIEVTAQRVICTSDGTQDYTSDDTKWWGN